MCVSSMILQEIVAAIFIAVGLALRIFAQCKKKELTYYYRFRVIIGSTTAILVIFRYRKNYCRQFLLKNILFIEMTIVLFCF